MHNHLHINPPFVLHTGFRLIRHYFRWHALLRKWGFSSVNQRQLVLLNAKSTSVMGIPSLERAYFSNYNIIYGCRFLSPTICILHKICITLVEIKRSQNAGSRRASFSTNGIPIKYITIYIQCFILFSNIPFLSLTVEILVLS